ncbi:hypothetical protein [uncultured Methanobrevibacter sp.]|uniref:hypothetical protein n=1 Tax=uncultured Methanobrevibacter sp. TaxID=253161 RepID=UPI0025F4ABF5|nr:hypothetical protein [uncultured Methanobrevibacter sp.]
MNVCIEFDVNTSFTANNPIFRFRKNRWASINADFDSNGLSMSTDVWYHIKFVATSSKITPFVDGVEKQYKTPNDTFDTFMIALNNGSISNMKYKNFIVYEIQ